MPRASPVGGMVLALVTELAIATASAARADVRVFHEFGLSLAAPTGVVGTASYAPTLSLAGDRLHVGLGPRLSAYVDTGTVRYPNGDARLLAAGAHDALEVRRPATYAVNAMLAVSLRLVAGLEVGANIDLVGIGFGPGVVGAYAGSDPAHLGPQFASPTTFNLLLLGTHDRGQLDSELFVAWWWRGWGVRAGVSHMSTEYTTDRKLDGGNDRFRASATRFFVGAGYRLTD